MKKTKENIFDELLVLQFQSGQKIALTILVKRWHKKIIYHSYKFTKSKEASKDIAQDCWVIIFKGLHKLKDPSVFGAWVLSIVSNKSINWVRKQMKDRKTIDEFENADRNSSIKKNTSNETELKLKNAISKLPDKQRIVLNMFYMEEYTIREISKILSLKTGTVKSRLFHAREQLKKV